MRSQLYRLLNLFTLVCVGLLTNCSSPEKAYLRSLAESISLADEITITEHSHWSDLPSDQQLDATNYEIEYHRVSLSSETRSQFLTSVEQLPSTPSHFLAACSFEPHHTIRFYRTRILESEMRICFSCHQIIWKKSLPPEALIPLLRELVSSAGLTPDRDWALAAKDWLSRDTSTAQK